MISELQTLDCLTDAEFDVLRSGNPSAPDVDRALRHAVNCDRCRDALRDAGVLAASMTPHASTPEGDTGIGAKAARSSPHTGTNVDLERSSPGLADGGSSTWRRMLLPPQGPDELGRLGGYRILRVLGQGGMGVVFEAEDIALKRRVAVKVLRAGEIQPVDRKRFLQEAQLAASLASDHIVTVHQVGEDNDCMFIVMELLRGETLEDRLQREGSLPLVEMLRIAREAAEALSVAHEHQLVHRDIKPANIWLEAPRPNARAPRVKLLDFGIARPMAIHEHLTMGGVIGTPAFMSPEQACGMELDQRSDLFSLGSVMYAMLTGDSPFDRDGYVQELKAVVDEPPVPLRQRIPGIQVGAAKLVERLLNKDAHRRPAGARQVVDEIRQLEKDCTYTSLTTAEPTTGKNTRVVQLRNKLGWGVWFGFTVVLATAMLGAWSGYQRMTRQASTHAGPQSAAAAALPISAAPIGESPVAAAPAGLLPAAAPPAKAPSAAGPPAAASDNAPAALPVAGLPPIKIGIIHSLSGPMAVTERPIVDAFLLAVNEINENGGLMKGRLVEAIVRDGKSNEAIFAEQAEDLISNEHVVTLFGCWRSPCRKLVEEVCARHNHLLVFPTTYEGLEESPYVIYMGGAPNQQIIPAVKWTFAFLEKRRFFCVGADGIYSHCAHEIIRDELTRLGGVVVGEAYRPLGDGRFAGIVEQIVQSKADILINTVSGAGNVGLFTCLREAGLTPDKLPTMSLRVTEQDLVTIADHEVELQGDFGVWSYFTSLPNQENQDFLERWHQRYGPTRGVDDPMVAAYSGMYVWARAVEATQSDKVAEIRGAMVDQPFEAPEGNLVVAPANRHACRRAMIGRVNADLRYELVWSSPKPIPPEPFPPTRTREQWLQLEADLFKQWDGHWRPQAPTKR